MYMLVALSLSGLYIDFNYFNSFFIFCTPNPKGSGILTAEHGGAVHQAMDPGCC